VISHRSGETSDDFIAISRWPLPRADQDGRALSRRARRRSTTSSFASRRSSGGAARFAGRTPFHGRARTGMNDGRAVRRLAVGGSPRTLPLPQRFGIVWHERTSGKRAPEPVTSLPSSPRCAGVWRASGIGRSRRRHGLPIIARVALRRCRPARLSRRTSEGAAGRAGVAVMDVRDDVTTRLPPGRYRLSASRASSGASMRSSSTSPSAASRPSSSACVMSSASTSRRVRPARSCGARGHGGCALALPRERRRPVRSWRPSRPTGSDYAAAASRTDLGAIVLVDGLDVTTRDPAVGQFGIFPRPAAAVGAAGIPSSAADAASVFAPPAEATRRARSSYTDRGTSLERAIFRWSASTRRAAPSRRG